MNKSGILRKENTICVFINTFATLLIYFRVYLFTKKKKKYSFSQNGEKNSKRFSLLRKINL